MEQEPVGNLVVNLVRHIVKNIEAVADRSDISQSLVAKQF